MCTEADFFNLLKKISENAKNIFLHHLHQPVTKEYFSCYFPPQLLVITNIIFPLFYCVFIVCVHLTYCRKKTQNPAY